MVPKVDGPGTHYLDQLLAQLKRATAASRADPDPRDTGTAEGVNNVAAIACFAAHARHQPWPG
jgi:hypothetical protein